MKECAKRARHHQREPPRREPANWEPGPAGVISTGARTSGAGQRELPRSPGTAPAATALYHQQPGQTPPKHSSTAGRSAHHDQLGTARAPPTISQSRTKVSSAKIDSIRTSQSRHQRTAGQQSERPTYLLARKEQPAIAATATPNRSHLDGSQLTGSRLERSQLTRSQAIAMQERVKDFLLWLK